MIIQTIVGRSEAGDVVTASLGPDGAWTATIDHADGDSHKGVPVSVTTEPLAAALQAALDACP